MQIIMFSVVDILSWRSSVFLITIALISVHTLIKSHFNHFKKINIAQDSLPVYVQFFRCFSQSLFDIVKDAYLANKGHQFFGMFSIVRPTIMVSSPELIKRMCTQDFDHFTNHLLFVNPKIDTLFGNSLFAMHDEKWKNMRKAISPTFSSGKMRQMFQYTIECCCITTGYYKRQMETNPNLEVNVQNLFTRYTADVMGISILGVRINSQTDEDNEFYRLTLKATHFTNWQYFKVFLYGTFYKTMKFLNIRVFDAKFSQYLHDLVWDTIERRTKDHIPLPDFISILVDLRKQCEKTGSGRTHPIQWTEDELVAQCFILFTAGFETTSVTMGFLAYELMQSPNIQDKLIAEIDQCRKELAGSPLTYDVLNKMKYMNMVVEETLRKWPPIYGLDRLCTKPYTLTDDNGQCIKLNVGDSLVVPVSGIHRDPNFFPDPARFDPERFSDANKRDIVPYSYIPFGVGPRYCIGSRFALMQIKAIVFNLLSEFTFKPSPKSRIPVALVPSGFTLEPKHGFWMYLTPRTKLI